MVDHTPAGDAPESTRWTRSQYLGIAGYALLTFVIFSVGAMSFRGLVGFAETTLGITDGLKYLVPVSLDAAAITCAFLSMRAAILGDSAAGSRLLTFAFVAGSAGFNVIHANGTGGGVVAAVFFGGMSIAAWAIFEIVLRSIRRDMLRAAGAIEAPLVRFRAIRWIRFPLRTFRTFSIAVEHNITRADQALAIARMLDGRDELPVTAVSAPVMPGHPALTTGHPLVNTVHPDRTALDSLPSDAARVGRAIEVTGSRDVVTVTTWLAERGITVRHETARSAIRRYDRSRPDGMQDNETAGRPNE